MIEPLPKQYGPVDDYGIPVRKSDGTLRRSEFYEWMTDTDWAEIVGWFVVAGCLCMLIFSAWERTA